MALPNVFQVTPNPSISSYSYLDLASGQGYKRYYLVQSTDSASTNYFISPETIDSKEVSITYSGNNSANALRYDYDYDLLFNNPATIEGKSMFNFTLRSIGNSAVIYAEGYIVINIYHVNIAGTETLIGSVQSATRGTGIAATTYHRECLTEDLARTYFSVGQKLRINVQLYSAHIGIGNNSIAYYTDPTNFSAISGYDTDFSAYIPFKIDI